MIRFTPGADLKPSALQRTFARVIGREAFKRFSNAAFNIMRTAQASIVFSREPSSPGTPPHTRRGKHGMAPLRRAIRYKAYREGAVIGPRESVVGTSGAAHEHGGFYEGQRFDVRPFMLPALKNNLDRFARDWAGSIQ